MMVKHPMQESELRDGKQQKGTWTRDALRPVERHVGYSMGRKVGAWEASPPCPSVTVDS